ncbi:MAG: sodium/solute symporter [Planctomycetes bacterium]|nr:sodium/solute symporter [Planctomycetota bacterium]MCH9726664.1 sodium/solute symporter [Planctomycetota bacterium]MCH9779572.1 sodium/solute symporter [Planctomycetota bacterium]
MRFTLFCQSIFRIKWHSPRIVSQFLILFLIGFGSSSLFAADGTNTEAESAQVIIVEPPAGLATLDWAIIIIYASSTILLGWYFSRKQENTSEYFIGSGQMNPILIGVSLFATLLSTITYLSLPGEILGKGPIYLASYLALPIVYFIVGYWLIPAYMQQRVTSAYELLETKLGLSVRLLGAVMFLLLRLVWMSLLIYISAAALTTMLNLDDLYIPLIVLVTGLVSITYTSLGGLRAVVITDLVQTILLFGGALLVIATLSWKMGCFDWFPTSWNANWDTQPLYSFDPRTRVTFVGTILSVVIWYVATSGGDQVSVQRFMSTKDASAARRSLAIQLCVGCIVGATLALVGFCMLGYFQTFPAELPASIDLKKNADDIFPYVISYQLPIGISGLVVAAMFAAAMSSIDSGVNSITAVISTDFIDRFGKSFRSEKSHVRFARYLAFIIGIVVIYCSSFMGQIEGNITEVTGKTANLLTTPIFCLFVFAMFIPFAKPLGVWVGAICGTATAVVVAFSGFSYDIDISTYMFEFQGQISLEPFSFQWIAPTAVAVNLVTGSIVSLLISDTKKNSVASAD